MSSSTKPVIVLVPGAWHGPEHYGPLIKHLHAAGYETDAVALPSVGGELKNWDPDVEAIRASITKAVDANKEVVLVAHSYGGLPSQEACKGLDKATIESQGKKGGIIRLCWLCAFLGDEGASLMGYLGGQDLPWWNFEDQVSAIAINSHATHVNPLSLVFFPFYYSKTRSECTRRRKPRTSATMTSRTLTPSTGPR